MECRLAAPNQASLTLTQGYEPSSGHWRQLPEMRQAGTCNKPLAVTSVAGSRFICHGMCEPSKKRETSVRPAMAVRLLVWEVESMSSAAMGIGHCWPY